MKLKISISLSVGEIPGTFAIIVMSYCPRWHTSVCCSAWIGVNSMIEILFEATSRFKIYFTDGGIGHFLHV